MFTWVAADSNYLENFYSLDNDLNKESNSPKNMYFVQKDFINEFEVC